MYTPVKGRSHARNLGIQHAKGDWICFLDSDDMYTEDHLSKMYKSIATSPNADIHKTGVIFKTEDDQVSFKSSFLPEGESFSAFLIKEYTSIQELAIRKSLVKRNYFKHIEFWEDKLYLLDMSENIVVNQIKSRTVVAHEHKSRSINSALTQVEEINKTLKAMEVFFNTSKVHSREDSSFTKENFISSLIANALQNKMPLIKILRNLNRINSNRRLFYYLKTVYYRFRYK